MFVFRLGTFLLLPHFWLLFVKTALVTFANGHVFQSTAAISFPSISKIFGRFNLPDHVISKETQMPI